MRRKYGMWQTPNQNLTYWKSLLHKPDREKGSHIFQSRILNHHQHPHAVHLCRRSECGLLEYLSSAMMILKQTNCASNWELSERWVQPLMEIDCNWTRFLRLALIVVKIALARTSGVTPVVYPLIKGCHSIAFKCGMGVSLSSPICSHEDFA
jgi:hypothetical protein